MSTYTQTFYSVSHFPFYFNYTVLTQVQPASTYSFGIAIDPRHSTRSTVNISKKAFIRIHWSDRAIVGAYPPSNLEIPNSYLPHEILYYTEFLPSSPIYIYVYMCMYIYTTTILRDRYSQHGLYIHFLARQMKINCTSILYARNAPSLIQ